MPLCPRCKAEYAQGLETCAECGAKLAGPLSRRSSDERNLVMVYDAPDRTSAEIAWATLRSAGIAAELINPVGSAAGTLPYLDLALRQGVLVPAGLLSAAQDILRPGILTESELTAEEDLDSETLEDAERRVQRM